MPNLPRKVWGGGKSPSCLKSFKSTVVLDVFPITSPTAIFHLSNPLFSTSFNMIFSTVVAVSVLSLFSFTRAATIHARGDSCAFVCPDKDLDGDTLVGSTRGAILSCSYTGKSSKWCTYNAVSSIPLSYFYPPRLTMLPRPLECPWAIAIAPRPQFKNASDATAGSSSRQLSVEAVTTTTEIRTGKFRAMTSNGSAAGPRA